MTEDDAIDVLRTAGLLPGLIATAQLLAEGSDDDEANGPRWELMCDGEIIDHMIGHVRYVSADTTRIDDDSGHPEACHVAARGLMLATRATLWDPAGDEPPPVELPEGMTWSKTHGYSRGYWDVKQSSDLVGFVAPRLNTGRWLSHVTVPVARDLPTQTTAIEAARALASALWAAR